MIPKVMFVGTLPTQPEKWWLERNLRRIGRRLDEFVWAEFPTRELIEQQNVKVMVPLGDARTQKDHAYCIQTAWGIPEIPTFHPKYILNGNQKLSGAWCFAMQRALRLASGQEQLRKYDLLLDPGIGAARDYFERGGLETLVCDIETSDWGGDEDEAEESTGNIVRISFSNRVDTAISFPFLPPYVALCGDILLRAKNVIFWNQSFDLPRLQAAGASCSGRVIDAMFAWHWLQSDLPKALAFVAPLFCMIEPWKHLNSAQPTYYSAMDSAITMDCYLGIRQQLETDGRWHDFERQCVRMFPILTQMSKAGVKLDLDHQQKFKARLEVERDSKLAEIQQQVPLEIRPFKLYKRKPKNMTDVRCLGEDAGYSRLLPFNPASPKQVKGLIRHLGLRVPKGKGDDKESTEAKHLKALSRKNSIFRTILEYRERSKIIDTYMWTTGPDCRVHASAGFNPSTWRKAYRNPNVQTVPKRNDLAQEFRRMVVADENSLLVECDSSAIEAVLVGYFGGSERYIDLAKKGVHKWLAEQYAGRPVSKSEPLYDQIKRVVHLSNYCGTPQRIVEEYPELFMPSDEVVSKIRSKLQMKYKDYLDSVIEVEIDKEIHRIAFKAAKGLQDFYFNTEPGKDVRAWQQATLQLAHKEHKLDTPFGQRHYFYDVFTKKNKKWSNGTDAKRAVAFRPQAAASAIQTEFVLAIADHHQWMLPHLRWLIHDSIVAEVPAEDAERFALELVEVMTMKHPQLDGLSVGAECKVGPNLAEMKGLN